MKKIFLLFVFSSLILNAQNEYLVNTFKDSIQRSPVVAKDGSGNYVVVWQSLNQAAANSNYDIYMQLYNSSDEKIGGEILVNQTTAGAQEKPAVAMNNNGKVVVVWSSYSNAVSSFDIKARMFELNNPVTVELLVNSTFANAQNNPAVDINSDGEFLVTWDSWDQDGGDRGVYMKRFDGTGSVLNEETLVNQTTAYSQAKPRIKYFPDG